MKKEKILDNLSYFIFVILGILTLIFQKNMSLILLIYSIGAVIIGLIYIIGRKNYGTLILAVGANVFATYLLHYYHILTLPKAITFMICSSIVTILVLTMVVDFIRRAGLKKIYSLSVEAEVIDLIREPNSKREFYMPLYKYKVRDLEYEVELPVYKNRFIPKIGSKMVLSVNPNNPEEVYFFPTKRYIILNFLGSLLFVIVCLFIIISIFR